MDRHRTLAAIVAPLLLTVAVAGCSKDSSDGAAKPSVSATTAVKRSTGSKGDGVAKPGIVSPSLPTAPKLAGATGIRSDAKVASCGTTSGAVTANGSVTNSSSKPADILVSVSWVAGSRSDVVARSFAKLEQVGAKEQVKWKASAELAKGYDDVQCVLNVRRGTLS